MFQDKVKQSGQILKQNLTETFKLLWSFKWYVGLYLSYYIISIISLFDIPAADDKIFHAEATSQIWSYTNQNVYIGSLKLEIIILSLLFLLGTSNMRNHPKIARFIFILPWIYATVRLIKLF